MAKKLVFAKDKNFTGWKCKGCGWAKPIGRFVESGDPVPADVQADFEAHECNLATYPRSKREDFSQAAARIVREATEDK